MKFQIQAFVSILILILMFGVSIFVMVFVNRVEISKIKRYHQWWERAIIYHIVIPSFYDSNGDGFGDINGIKEKIPYIKSLGVNAIWLSPFYKSGSKDLSYDVMDPYDVNSLFGNKKQLMELLSLMEENGLYAIISFIPNHTSNKCEWFKKCINGDPEYKDYYVFRDKKNEWTSYTGNSSWTVNPNNINEYYLHHFLPAMPDLNLKNEKVRQDLKKVMRFWLKHPAVYGLHISGVNLLMEEFDDPEVVNCNVSETIDLIDEWKEVTEESLAEDYNRRLLILEMLTTEHIPDWRTLFLNTSFGTAVVPFEFGLTLADDSITNKGDVLGCRIREHMRDVPNSIWPTWEIDNTNMVGLNKGYGRIPKKMNRVSMMMAMLLPGNVIIYYGDEIGMENNSELTFADAEDPYPTEENYQKKSRDPSRCPMQWSAKKNGGFTNGTDEPWLPVHSSFRSVNVESQSKPNSKDNNLRLFKEFVRLRSTDDFYDGETYFPYQGYDTFAFMRKITESNTAHLIVANLSDQPHTADFTTIYPNFPKNGIVEIVTHEYTCDYMVGDMVDFSELKLSTYLGLVIKINLTDSESMEKVLFEA